MTSNEYFQKKKASSHPAPSPLSPSKFPPLSLPARNKSLQLPGYSCGEIAGLFSFNVMVTQNIEIAADSVSSPLC